MLSIRLFAMACLSACLVILPVGATEPVPSPREVSAAAMAKTLTPPLFITEDHLRMTSDNHLEIMLPHPNADGWDSSGRENWRYVIRIMRGCNEYVSSTVTRNAYPALYRTPFEIPFDDYEVQIARQTTFGPKRDLSQGTVIVGPPSGTKPSAISDDFVEIERWLLHIPRKSGGFEGSLTFHNLFPETPAKIWVGGFDIEGNPVPGTARPVLVVGQRPEVPIYGDENALFETAFQDQVSHVGLYEEDGKRLITTALTYKHVEENALTATVNEVDLINGDTVGSQFVMESRKSEAYWDGIAVTNLAALAQANVRVVLRRLADGSQVASESLGSVAPGSKTLHVISDLFTFQPDVYYTVESSGAVGTIQVLALRGSLQSSTPLLVGSSAFKTK